MDIIDFVNAFVNKEWQPGYHPRKIAQVSYATVQGIGLIEKFRNSAIMKEFREGATRVLITTDVWARGLDVQQVSPCATSLLAWNGSFAGLELELVLKWPTARSQGLSCGISIERANSDNIEHPSMHVE